MLLKKVSNELELERINEQTKIQVNNSVKFAEEASYPDKKDVYNYIYEQKNYPFIVE